MSYLITGIVFSLISWYITRDKYKKELIKNNKSSDRHHEMLMSHIILLLNKNKSLLKQIEEFKSGIVVIKSMKGERQ